MNDDDYYRFFSLSHFFFFRVEPIWIPFPGRAANVWVIEYFAWTYYHHFFYCLRSAKLFLNEKTIFLSFSLFTKLFISLSLFLSLSFPEWKRQLVFSSFIFFIFSEWGWRKERNVSRSRVEEIIIFSEEGWLLKIGGMFAIQTLDGFFKVLPCVEFPSNWDESHWKFSVKLEKWLRGLLFFRIISFVDLSKVKTFFLLSVDTKRHLKKKISWTAAVVVVVVKESFFEFKKIEVTFSSPIEVFETHVLCMIRKVETFKSNFLSDCFLFVEKK